MQIDSYDVKFSPVWEYMFKFPNWTPGRSCEILTCSNAVFINLEQFSQFVLVFLLLLWTYIFLPGVFITGIAPEFLGNFLKSLENQEISRRNSSYWLIPLKLRLILKAKFVDNLLIYRIQYFVGISLLVHIKLFLYVGRKSNFVQNKANKVVVFISY